MSISNEEADSDISFEEEEGSRVSKYEMHSDSIRKSLECSSVAVDIVSHSVLNSGSSTHVEYDIEVSSGGRHWIVKKRYNDFKKLDHDVRKSIKDVELPTLPPKRIFGSSTEKKFLDERMSNLKTYLQALLKVQGVWTKGEVVRFLDNENNSLTFLWNLDRMRKMQDILSTMLLENKSETERLNVDLYSARQQVQQLQDRIARMEMLFLQHAAGVADNKIPRSLLQNLSGIESLAMCECCKGLETCKHSKKSGKKTRNSRNGVSETLVESIVDGQATAKAPMSPTEVVKVLDNLNQKNDSRWRSHSTNDVKAMAVSIKLQETIRLSEEILNEGFAFNNESSAEDNNDDQTAEQTDGNVESLSHSNSTLVALDQLLAFKSDENQDVSLEQKWVTDAFSVIDDIVMNLIPSMVTQIANLKVFEQLRHLFHATLNVHLFPIGSFVSNTYLPNSSLGVTAYFVKNTDENWYVRVNEILCMSAFESLPSGNLSVFREDLEKIAVSNVSFVNADRKHIKAMINNVSIDISANNLNSLYFGAFMERVNQFVGKDNLFKRSLFLLKVWFDQDLCRYADNSSSNTTNSCVTNSICGASLGNPSKLSSSAITTMLIYVFNAFGASINHPLQAFIRFLQFFTNFDFHKYAISVFGPLNASNLSPLTREEHALFPPADFIPKDLLEFDKLRFKKARESCVVNNVNNLLQVQPLYNNFTVNKDATASAEQLSVTTPTGAANTSATTQFTTNEGNPCNSISDNSNLGEAIEDFINYSTIYDSLIQSVENDVLSQVVDSFTFKSAFNEHGQNNYHKRALMTVVNPVDDKVNLTKSIDMASLQGVKCAFRNGFNGLVENMENIKKNCFDAAKLFIGANNDGSDESSGVCSFYDTIGSNMNISAISSENHCNCPKEKVAFTSFLKNLSSIPSEVNTEITQRSANEVLHSAFLNTCNSIIIPRLKSSVVSNIQLLECQLEELDFSISFSELIFGSAISKNVVISLVKNILNLKGPMPVGEVGKYLQYISNSETVSRRLKEQFGGLKKTLELTSDTQIRMGNEHPFNPNVSLTHNNGFISKQPNRFKHCYNLVNYFVSNQINFSSNSTVTSVTTNNSSVKNGNNLTISLNAPPANASSAASTPGSSGKKSSTPGGGSASSVSNTNVSSSSNGSGGSHRGNKNTHGSSNSSGYHMGGSSPAGSQAMSPMASMASMASSGNPYMRPGGPNYPYLMTPESTPYLIASTMPYIINNGDGSGSMYNAGPKTSMYNGAMGGYGVISYAPMSNGGMYVSSAQPYSAPSPTQVGPISTSTSMKALSPSGTSGTSGTTHSNNTGSNSSSSVASNGSK